jgi:integrase
MGRRGTNHTEKAILAAIKKAKQSGNDTWSSDGTGLTVRGLPGGLAKFYRRYVSPTTSKRITQYIADFDPEGVAGITLAEARVRNAERTKLINDGVDPVEHAEREKLKAETAQRAAEEQARLESMEVTVQGLFNEWFENRILPKFTKPNWLKVDIFASVLAHQFKPDGKHGLAFRELRAKDVTSHHIVSIVEATQKRGANTLANDQLRYLERMFAYAINKGYLDMSPMARIEKREVRHPEQSRNRALSLPELRTVLRSVEGMRASWQVQGVIQMTIYTAQRTGYVCQMEWAEVHGGEWHIPPEKQMKESRRKTAPQTHIVYLPEQAVRLLDTLKTPSGDGKYVFPSDHAKRAGQPVVQATVEQAIGRHLAAMPGQGFRTDKKLAEDPKPYWDMPHWNAHDLRRTVATRMAEDVGIAPHIIEKILNHSPSNELAAIYNRASYERERKEAANQWGRYLAGLLADNVVRLAH